jgi:uncharacterized membrane protein YesL
MIEPVFWALTLLALLVIVVMMLGVVVLGLLAWQTAMEIWREIQQEKPLRYR